jgi:4-hydroxy-3-methylbut-2-en-1-yl diphosphate reductase
VQVVLARPRGFCAGVDRAIEIVELALEAFGPPVYVRHEIVHNRHVVDELRAKGAIFVDDTEDIPEGGTVVFSAHGVSPQVRSEAEQRRLRAIDATCPLVTKVHLEAVRYAREGYTILLIGHPGHVEVEGTMGEAPHAMRLVTCVEDARTVEVVDPRRVAYLTQTTLSVDDTIAIVEELRRRFPDIRGPRKDDICYATQNRQNAAKELARTCQLILVVGSQESSNSNRLVEVAHAAGVQAHLVNDARDLDPAWLHGYERIGLTSGASTPEALVSGVLERLRAIGPVEVIEIETAAENVTFPLPVELRRMTAAETSRP